MKQLIILNDLHDLIVLRDLYNRENEKTQHGFYTLSNFIKWFQLDPHLDFVSVYVVNNTWREKGFFIIQDRYQLLINCVVYDEDEVATALKTLNWNKAYKITALPETLIAIVQKTLQELDVSYKLVTLRTYQRSNKDIFNAAEAKCPGVFEIRQLTVPDASTINNLWYSRQEGSLQFFESLIRYNISLGVYSKERNELIAWCTRCPCGFLGSLHVREEYRRLGLASLLINEFSQRVAREGDSVRVMINETNLKSRDLFAKFQFAFQEKVFILVCKPSGMKTC